MHAIFLRTPLTKMQRSSPTPPVHVTLVNLGRVVEAKGGVEKVFCELANNLLSLGFIVNAVCCDKQQGRPGFPLSQDANFHNCWKDNRNFLLSRPICNLRSLHPNRNIRRIQRTQLLDKMYQAKLQPHLSSIETDIWICFQPESTYVIKELLKMPQPAITMFHQNPNFFLQNPESQLFKKTIEEDSILQVLMPEFVSEFKRILPKATIVHIPNSVAPSTKIAQLTNKKIINVGRITNGKHQLLAVKAFHKLAGKYPDWTIEFWGEDDENPRYAKQVKKSIQKLGLEKQVFLKGTTDNIQEKLIDSSIFLFPSESEGFALALVEAMSCGLPSIGRFDCSAVNTLIEHQKNGLLCQGTPDSVAEALEYLISSSQERQRMGANARNKSLNFSPTSVWQAWKDLILETLTLAKS